jgi:hypothetical protein
VRILDRIPALHKRRCGATRAVSRSIHREHDGLQSHEASPKNAI